MWDNINLGLTVYLWEFGWKSAIEVGYFWSIQMSPVHSDSINALYTLIYYPVNTTVCMVTCQERNSGSSHCNNRRLLSSPEHPYRLLAPPSPLFVRKLWVFQEFKRARVWTWAIGFGGLEVACWPLVPKFAGSNPTEAFGFFRANKILSTPSFGREVKPFVPKVYAWKLQLSVEITVHISPK